VRLWSANNNNRQPDDDEIVGISRQLVLSELGQAEEGMEATRSISTLSNDKTMQNSPADDENSDRSARGNANMLSYRGQLNPVDEEAASHFNASPDAASSLAARPPQRGKSPGKDAGEEPGLWELLTEEHPKLTPIDEMPSDAVPHLAPDGETSFAPPDADFHRVYEAGKANGLSPGAALRAIGQLG
jgi:hypothetical protein